jgi:hypothetical protein
MTDGQTRVLMLLVVLFALEAVRAPGIKAFLNNAFVQWNNALNTQAKKK